MPMVAAAAVEVAAEVAVEVAPAARLDEDDTCISAADD
jgi:hypothetical protein